MKHQRGLDYKYPCELQAFKLIPQACINWSTYAKSLHGSLDCHVIFSERRLSDIEQLPYSSDKSVVSNKIKIITNCIRIDLCIWRSQNMYITAFTAPRESFAVEFVVMKHFGCESSNVQPCCLDVVVYMLNCVFWWHIPLEIEFKVVAQTMHSGVTHERCADLRHGKKKQKRVEFITPPRPTGRRSNNGQSTLLLYCCEDVKSHRSGGDTVPLIHR